MVDEVWRVVRTEKGALFVVPVPGLVPDEAGARPGDDEEPRRVALARDGLAPAPWASAGEWPAAGEPRVVPTVGDLVALDDDGAVRRVLPRRTVLVRDSANRTSRTQVLAANVDVVLVVEHLDPEPDLGRVERLLTLAWRSGARPVVVLTKADLVPDPAFLADEVAAVAVAVDVHTAAVPTGQGLDRLRALLAPGVTFVVVGPSGAGKSTLINALAGRQVAATGDRRADGRGRHTTTHRELVVLDGGALLIDTPGLRTVGMVADEGALDLAFADVAALAARCRFSDCSHTVEPGCAVLAALDSGKLPERRLASWRKLEREAAFQARRADRGLQAAERARWKRITRQYRGLARGGRP
jgi:ribosome biogenesis GTPase